MFGTGVPTGAKSCTTLLTASWLQWIRSPLQRNLPSQSKNIVPSKTLDCKKSISESTRCPCSACSHQCITLYTFARPLAPLQDCICELPCTVEEPNKKEPKEREILAGVRCNVISCERNVFVILLHVWPPFLLVPWRRALPLLLQSKCENEARFFFEKNPDCHN